LHKEEEEQSPPQQPPSFFLLSQTTANDSEHAPSLQVIFFPSLIRLAGLFHLHAEHEQFMFCSK
jgi:hypothetical protein